LTDFKSAAAANPFPGDDPKDDELAARIGARPADVLQREGARVTAIYAAMRAERGLYGASRYNYTMLDAWREATRLRMHGQSPVGQLREIYRFERQLVDLASGAYNERQAELARQAAEADAARHRAEAPAALLARLRRDGVALALDDEGRLTVPPGTNLHLNVVAEIKDHRAALVALLRAEAEAARPVVIA
jgi:hypothetical protein